MVSISFLLEMLLLALTLAGIVYHGLSIVAAADFFAKDDTSPDPAELPPATILVPVAEADADAYHTFASFCLQDYPEHQVLFSAHSAGDSAVPVIRRVIAELGAENADLIISGDGVGQNAKVNNLHNALREAKYERIVMLDSDIRIRPDYLRSIVPLLSDERVGLVTCLYRSAGASSVAAKIESIGLTADFAPGVLVARFLQGIQFALGCTMATVKSKLESIGGFRAVADYLADDYMIGNLIAKAGYQVRISHHVVETLVKPSSLQDLIKHQLRWARTTRFSRPAGYLGLIFTHCTPLALLYCLCAHGSPASMEVLGLAVGARMLAGWWIGVHWLKDSVLRKNFFLLPATDVFGFIVWCCGLAGSSVEWGQRLLRIDNRGKIVHASPLQPRVPVSYAAFDKSKTKFSPE